MRDRVADTARGLRRELNDSLFPAAPRPSRSAGGWEIALLVAAFFALAVVLQLVRPGPENALGALWAEDGQVFLGGALSTGFWDAITTPYNGYLVLVPRLIGELAALFPLRDAAAVTAIAATLVVALSGLVVWFASAALIRNPYLRATLVGLTVLCPIAGLESVASSSYVLWYMLVACFWILLWRPARLSTALLAAAFLLATGLTTPGLWFFAPLAALRAFAARDRVDLAILAGYGVGAAAQVPVLLANSAETVDPLWTSAIWTTLLQRLVDGGALGERVGGEAWVLLGWPLLIALLAAALVGLAYGLRRATASGRWFAAVAVPTALLMFVVSLYQRAVGGAMRWPPNDYFGNGGRYAIVPALLLVGTALVLIDRARRPAAGPARLPWASLAAVVVLWLGIVSSLYLASPQARGTPRWDESLDRAALSCAGQPEQSVGVPISPPGFAVPVPCAELSRKAER